MLKGKRVLKREGDAEWGESAEWEGDVEREESAEEGR
jgi:hypothetical protein